MPVRCSRFHCVKGTGETLPLCRLELMENIYIYIRVYSRLRGWRVREHETNFSERKRKFSPLDGVFYPVRAIDPLDEIPAGLSLTLNAHCSRRFFFLLFLPSLLSLFSFCCLSSLFFSFFLSFIFLDGSGSSWTKDRKLRGG